MLPQTRSLDIIAATTYSPTAATLFGLPGAGIGRSNNLFDQQTYAVFGQVEVQPIEALTLTAGLRYEKFRDELNRDRPYIAKPVLKEQASSKLRFEATALCAVGQ